MQQWGYPLCRQINFLLFWKKNNILNITLIFKQSLEAVYSLSYE